MKDQSKGGPWNSMGHVTVPGNPDAKSREEDPEMLSWRRVALLTLDHTIGAYIGFISQFSPIPVMYSIPISASEVGMRLGPEQVTFVAQSINGQPVSITLAGVVDVDDPAYASFPLF